MTNLSIIEWIKLLGFVLVVTATVISTVKIPSIDKKISQVDGDIAKFKDSRIQAHLCTLHYGEQFTRRRIELFEANQIMLSGGDKESIEELRKRALDQTIELAKQWAFLLGEDKATAMVEDTNKKISEIIANKGMTTEIKIDKAEKIWKENQAAASKRIEDAHKKWHENETIKENFENNRSFLNKWFVWLQILGLILFSGAEIVGKLLKK